MGIWCSPSSRASSSSAEISRLVRRVCSAICWLAFSFGFSLYFDFYSGASDMYGSMTSVVLILLWLYVCMYIILLGGEINAILEGYGYIGKRRVDKLKTYDKMKK